MQCLKLQKAYLKSMELKLNCYDLLYGMKYDNSFYFIAWCCGPDDGSC